MIHEMTHKIGRVNLDPNKKEWSSVGQRQSRVFELFPMFGDQPVGAPALSVPLSSGKLMPGSTVYA